MAAVDDLPAFVEWMVATACGGGDAALSTVVCLRSAVATRASGGTGTTAPLEVVARAVVPAVRYVLLVYWPGCIVLLFTQLGWRVCISQRCCCCTKCVQ